MNHRRLRADDLREVIEVLVSRVQGKVVLQYKSREPYIVRRNRCALFPELAEHGRVVVGRLVVGKEHTHAIFQEETSQDPLVVGLTTTVREAGPELADDDEGSASAASTALSAFHVLAISARSRRFRRLPAAPEPSASASTAASFRLLPAARARSRRAASTVAGMPRSVYCMHLL